MTWPLFLSFLSAVLPYVLIALPFLIALVLSIPWVQAHTTAAQRSNLSTFALKAVQTAEQTTQGQPGSVKMAEAEKVFLDDLATHKIHLPTAQEVASVLEQSVYAMKKGVVSFPLHTAAPVDGAATAPPPVDVVGIAAQVTDIVKIALEGHMPDIMRSALSTLLSAPATTTTPITINAAPQPPLADPAPPANTPGV